MGVGVDEYEEEDVVVIGVDAELIVVALSVVDRNAACAEAAKKEVAREN